MIFKKKKMTMEEMLKKQLTCKHEKYEFTDVEFIETNNKVTTINMLECRDCGKKGKQIRTREMNWRVKE